jgi:hypothetical protein
MGSVTSMQAPSQASIDQYGIFKRAMAPGEVPDRAADSRKITQFLTFNNLVDRPFNEDSLQLNA